MTTPTVLITGATGFLGGATLAQLLRAHDCRVIALVRASSEAEGRARVMRSLARFESGDVRAVAAVEVVCGDITEPATLEISRIDAATHVLHLAANTSFRSVRGVRRTNILGTMTFAHRMRRAPRIDRFLHVGTAFSCGLIGTGIVVGEDDYPREGIRHLVEYTNSKAEAEILLENTAPELPLVIARPSIVIGHSRLGTAPSASIFWYYRAVDLLRRVTWPMEAREDIVPVDYVAQALVMLLLKPQLAHRRYHVSAGPAAACSWHEIAAAFARHHGAREDDPYRKMDLEEILRDRKRFTRLGEGEEEQMAMALGLYYRFPNLVFDNARLLRESVPPPPRFVDYVDLCMTRPGGRTVFEQMNDDD